MAHRREEKSFVDMDIDNQINGYPLTSPPKTMLTSSPVTDLIHEEKISGDNDQQELPLQATSTLHKISLQSIIAYLCPGID